MVQVPTLAEMTDRVGKGEAVVMTPFGPAVIEGPFAADYTKLKWQWTDHWSGEIAEFRVGGLQAYVRDCDGDSSWWHIKDLRTNRVVAKGEDWGFDPPNFWKCLVEAEAALRHEVARRVAAIRSAAMIAEILGPSGRVHYRRPPDDPLVAEARRTPGYTVRVVRTPTIENPSVVWCAGCDREIDFRRLADCHPFGTPGCAFNDRLKK